MKGTSSLSCNNSSSGFIQNLVISSKETLHWVNLYCEVRQLFVTMILILRKKRSKVVVEGIKFNTECVHQDNP